LLAARLIVRTVTLALDDQSIGCEIVDLALDGNSFGRIHVD